MEDQLEGDKVENIILYENSPAEVARVENVYENMHSMAKEED